VQRDANGDRHDRDGLVRDCVAEVGIAGRTGPALGRRAGGLVARGADGRKSQLVDGEDRLDVRARAEPSAGGICADDRDAGQLRPPTAATAAATRSSCAIASCG
jgi:hypothetical protein